VEPAVGTGAIALPLRDAGHTVVTSDILDYGLPGTTVTDYLTAALPFGIEGIITNPPFRLAGAFLHKALLEVGYIALLVRATFVMEGTRRMPLLQAHPPTRLWLSARRFPMMHRHTWAGKRSSSNTPHAWAVWQRDAKRESRRAHNWCGCGSISATRSEASSSRSVWSPARVADNELSVARNCTRDEGGPFEFGDQEPISSHRKPLRAEAAVVSVAETSRPDFGRHGISAPV
jgi:hypothetical protein